MVLEDDCNHDGSVSELLTRLLGGQPEVQARLMNIVYGELRRRAAMFMAGERADPLCNPPP
jgi:type II secretory pathway predicted ATPase ExeA